MKKTKLILMTIMFMITLSFMAFAFAEDLENGSKVKPNSELTYYLNVEYDGKDEEAKVSGKDATANVKSDYIEVEDKLPDGLEFVRVIDPGSGPIGAVEKKDGKTTCSGYVVGGVEGVTYNPNTHTVSFKVRNLGAGCKLTVGIVTMTPDDNGTRQDFYNTFQAVEDQLTIVSNQVHVYMGDESAQLHEVKYLYEEGTPENAPALPTGDEVSKYAKGTNVVVANDVNLTGYEFNGWKLSEEDEKDVTITNGKFTMPDHDVTLYGGFSKKQSYKVKYVIEGDAPKNFIAPSEESYYENMNVTVDTLQKNDVVDGYRFLGWVVDNIVVDEGIFQMPTHDVTIRGSFERISYTVTYKFIGTNLPTNSNTLLPASETHYPGDKVTLTYPGKVEGFKFLGWYHKDNFTMPEENVVIQGEWGISAGLFEPTITKEIINKKDVYKLGDVVNFKITVTNTADFAIRDIMIRENNEQAKFTSGTGYEVTTDHIATIATMQPKETVILYAEYTVTEESEEVVVNEVEIVGALTDNGYQMDDSKEYKSSVEFNTNENIILAPNTDLNESYVIEIISVLLILCGIGGITYAIIARKKRKK